MDHNEQVWYPGTYPGYDQNSQIWYQGTPDYTAKLTLELTLMDTPLTCHY